VTFHNDQSLDHILGDTAGGITMIGSQGCTIARAMPRGAQAAAAISSVGTSVLHADGGLEAHMSGMAASNSLQAPRGQSLSDSSTRIYVTGPVQEIGADALQYHFGQFGLVKDVYIPVDHVSGLQKPFAFVTMNSPEEQQMVLAVPTHQLTEEISVNVTYAAPRSGGKGGDVGRGFGAGGGLVGNEVLFQDMSDGFSAAPMVAPGLKGGHLGRHPSATAGAAIVSGPPGTPNGPKQGVPGDYRVIVLGMPDGLNGDMLRGHFARHGEILDVYIPVRTPDIAYITFGTELEMQDALVNSGLSIAGFQCNELKQAVPKEKGGKGAGKRAGPY